MRLLHLSQSLLWAALCPFVHCIVIRGSSSATQTSTRGNFSAGASSQCNLPDFASWCTVTPATGRNFQIAVYRYNDIVSNSICNQGYWEMRDASELGTPGTALDIGSNIGYHSFLLADAGWRVEAFEPLPKNLELIQATACQNPHLAEKITIHGIGLGPREDSCVFVSGFDNVGDGWVRCGDEANRIRAGQDPVPAGFQLRGSFPVKRLDDILMQVGAPKKIDFVKIDVEGFECQVFKGGDSLLKHYRPRSIQSEVWPKMDHCLPADYLNMFKQANYKVAKTRGCEWPDSTLSGQIQDFFMCREGPVLLQLK